jgi:tRNA (cmo5U34)-methyltransferase
MATRTTHTTRVARNGSIERTTDNRVLPSRSSPRITTVKSVFRRFGAPSRAPPRQGWAHRWAYRRPHDCALNAEGRGSVRRAHEPDRQESHEERHWLRSAKARLLVAMLRLSRLPLCPLIVARERFARGSRPRQPEPMVMDDSRGVVEYDQAGAVVLAPVHHVNALALSRLLPDRGALLDLGCGSGRLLARLAQGRPDVRSVGLDLSEPMLETGRRLLAQERLADRVELRSGDITTFDGEPPQRLDVVSCNFTLHQLPSEELVNRCLTAIRRTRKRTGCGVYIFDLTRLRSPRSWPTIVSMVDVPGPAFLQDSIASEQAAFTFAELTNLLRSAGLGDLQHHCAGPLQVHWAASRDVGPPGRWHDVPLPRGTRLATRAVLQSFPAALTGAS